MIHRNDHDAALSRISALEHELATAEENSERDGRRIAVLEYALAERRRHEPGRARSPKPPPTAPRHRAFEPIDERTIRGPVVSFAAAIGAFAALVIGAIALLV